jgi:hypothetical protein
MAVDVAAVCSSADANQGSQTLAIVLSVMFVLYTSVAIALSALTIYSVSQVGVASAGPVASRQVTGTETSLVALSR